MHDELSRIRALIRETTGELKRAREEEARTGEVHSKARERVLQLVAKIHDLENEYNTIVGKFNE